MFVVIFSMHFVSNYKKKQLHKLITYDTPTAGFGQSSFITFVSPNPIYTWQYINYRDTPHQDPCIDIKSSTPAYRLGDTEFKIMMRFTSGGPE